MDVEETVDRFEARKQQHIDISLKDEVQTPGMSQFDRVVLQHEALPEFDFSDIQLTTEVFGQPVSSPIFISSMTAGHSEGLVINQRLAQVAQGWNLVMGVGSQRRQLSDESAREEWQRIREVAPEAKLMGNLGLSQLIESGPEAVDRLVESIGAIGMFIHTNPLQEVLQAEGTPRFGGGLKALEELCRHSKTPIVLKETGCGFSTKTLNRLRGMGLYAVDVSGLGGTHWGRVEGCRSEAGSLLYESAKTYQDWGIPTVESLLACREVADRGYAIWSSGGIRNGLHVAKSIVLGAEMVGIAGPLMKAAILSVEDLEKYFRQIHYELQVALFCTGNRTVEQLREYQEWQLKTT